MKWRMKYVVSRPTLYSYAPVSNYDNRETPWDGGLGSMILVWQDYWIKSHCEKLKTID